jgi:Delta7-sterol 5-desaturase
MGLAVRTRTTDNPEKPISPTHSSNERFGSLAAPLFTIAILSGLALLTITGPKGFLQSISRYLVEFSVLFLFILVFGYLLPVGQFYYRYYLSKKSDPAKHIQDRWPTHKGIRREVRLSLSSIAIFAAMATVLYEMYLAGMTSIYRPFSQYPIYFPLSILLCALLHDTYFYWTHRLMHWRPLFKYTHAGHHRSLTPTPWASYAFQPAEAVIQFMGIMLLVIFVPLSPLALFLFLCWDTMMNTAGHTGFEVVPQRVANHWLFHFFNTVTHHDNHHTNMRVNFGSFFNVWDRLMGTHYAPELVPPERALQRLSKAVTKNPQ